MYELRCDVVGKIPRPFRTIHQCFIVLGAKRKDIYVRGSDLVKRNRSIYNRYEKWELEYMAKELWKESIKKYHPDRSPKGEYEIYEYMTAEVNAAYDRILHLLNCKLG